MASFSCTFKPLQLHLSSFSRSNFSLNTYTPLLHDSSPSKLQLTPDANVRLAARSDTAALSGEITERISTNSVDSVPNPDFLSGLAPFSDSRKRAARKSPETDRNHAEKPTERRVILKDRYSKAGPNSKRRRDAGRLRSEKPVRSAEKITTPRESKAGAAKNGDNVEQKGKRAKKNGDNVERNMLRIGLDSCSKRGDIVGAIKLYELARKEGIKIEQYHYAVLLYLCSSAAAGVVQPAKSGSRIRTLSSGDRSSGSVSSNGNADMVNCGSSSLVDGEEGLNSSVNGSLDICGLSLDSFVQSMKKAAENSSSKNEGIQISKEMKRLALEKGFEIYKQMGMEKVEMNEATFTSVARMAMALGDGEMAFDIVKQMKEYGINPRLRSYGPALAIFSSNGDVENAFMVEKHMLENGVVPEEPELEALLRVSIDSGSSDKVYYILHKLRTSVRKVLPSTADLIEKWFTSKVASLVGKRKWDQELIMKAMENGGGGWHGIGWLGRGKWKVSRTCVGSDGICKSCGEKLVTIDLDQVETENFAKSVASIAAQREKNSSFEKFQVCWILYMVFVFLLG